jgi:hypothetical protein
MIEWPVPGAEVAEDEADDEAGDEAEAEEEAEGAAPQPRDANGSMVCSSDTIGVY